MEYHAQKIALEEQKLALIKEGAFVKIQNATRDNFLEVISELHGLFFSSYDNVLETAERSIAYHKGEIEKAAAEKKEEGGE